MKKITTYEVHGRMFDYEPTALCFEAIMLMRTMLYKDVYTSDKSEEVCDSMMYTDEQSDILLDLVASKYNQYQVPIDSIISDLKNGKLDFNDLTVNQIRGYIEDKMDEII